MNDQKKPGLKAKHGDIVLGVAFIVLAAAIFSICKRDDLRFYMNRAPGPGFMPMLSSALIGLCGLGITAGGIRQVISRNPEGDKALFNFSEIRSLLIVIGLGAASVLAAKYIGLMSSITVVMVLLIRFLGPEPWKTSLLAGIGTGIVMYVVFVVLLKVHVPVGPLGF